MVQLVDEQDIPTGLMEKMAAHRDPHLHRAISVFILNSSGEWLLHQRSSHKYHSRDLWSNACCTHPYEGESYPEAAAAYMKSYEMDSTRTQLLRLASEAYEKSGDAQKSLAVLEKFIATNGGRTADNLMDLGKKYYSLGTAKETTDATQKKTDLETADKIFGEVGALEPDNYRSFYWRGNAASTLDPEALTDFAKNYYSKALEIVQPKAKEDARYASIVATCIRYLTVYYYKSYERNKDEEAKKQCVKYAEQWLEIEPSSQVALQLIAL